MRGVTTVAAAVRAGGAARTWCLHDEPLHRARRLLGDDGSPRAARWREQAGRRVGALLTPEAACVAIGLVAGASTLSPLPALAGVAAALFTRRWVRRRAEHRIACARRAAVAELCTAVAGELRAGRPPHAALAHAVERGGWLSPTLAAAPWLTAVLAAARFGPDVPAALRRAAVLPGAEGLAGLAACWQVAVDGGSGLADGLDRVAATLRDEQNQREDLTAQLAGPRSTAALLAVLPVFGLLLGSALGAAPLRILLHTPVGLVCLAAGAVLEGVGIVWTARIVRNAAGEEARQ